MKISFHTNYSTSCVKRVVHLIMHIDGFCYALRVCPVADSVRCLQTLLCSMIPVVSAAYVTECF